MHPLMMIAPAYRYQAVTLDVHDGDTATFDLDLGLHIHARIPVRIVGVYAPELREADGALARKLLVNALTAAKNIVIETQKTKAGADEQSFARWLATVYIDGVDVAPVLAKAYEQAGIKPGGIGTKGASAE
jgi:endonuclease YncB( thermonuclease family)